MNRPRIAVVGVGALGQHHARILAGLDSADLVGVAEQNIKTGRAVAASCGTAHVTDFHDLLGHVDAVTIAVPTTAHLSVAGDCLKAGVPVMVEKPIAGTLNDAAALVALAEANDVLLQVGHIERFNPAVVAAMEQIDHPRYLRVERLSPFAFRSTDIGVVHDLMIHDLDLVLEIVAAPLTEVTAMGMSLMGGQEDSVQARLVFANGCIADLVASRVHPEPRRTLAAWSASGCVHVDLHTRKLTCYRPSETLLLGRSPTELAAMPGTDIERLKQRVFGEFIRVIEPKISDADVLTAELESFLDCLVSGCPPLVGGPEALRAMSAADAVLEAVDAHQWDGRAEGTSGLELGRAA